MKANPDAGGADGQPSLPTRMPRYVYIVSRHQPAFYAYLRERFADRENVEVILDRRGLGPPGRAPDPERRVRPDVDEALRVQGYAVVTLP